MSDSEDKKSKRRNKHRRKGRRRGRGGWRRRINYPSYYDIPGYYPFPYNAYSTFYGFPYHSYNLSRNHNYHPYFNCNNCNNCNNCLSGYPQQWQVYPREHCHTEHREHGGPCIPNTIEPCICHVQSWGPTSPNGGHPWNCSHPRAGGSGPGDSICQFIK